MSSKPSLVFRFITAPRWMGGVCLIFFPFLFLFLREGESEKGGEEQRERERKNLMEIPF